MSIIRQKQFGAVKAANKLAKRAWLEKQGSGFLGLARKGDNAVRAARGKILGGIDKQTITHSKGKTEYFKSLNNKINTKGEYAESSLLKNKFNPADTIRGLKGYGGAKRLNSNGEAISELNKIKIKK